MSRDIHCCGCGRTIAARLTDGREIYPHRPDLADLPFWRCDACGLHVGCHHRTKDRTRPLGVIPTKEISYARGHIHALLDPLWKRRRFSRREVYGLISERLGHEYHTAEIRTLDEARHVYGVSQEIARCVTVPAPAQPAPAPEGYGG